MAYEIAVWPDGFWCDSYEVSLYKHRSNDYEIIVADFDDDGEPILPERFKGTNWD